MQTLGVMSLFANLIHVDQALQFERHDLLGGFSIHDDRLVRSERQAWSSRRSALPSTDLEDACLIRNKVRVERVLGEN